MLNKEYFDKSGNLLKVKFRTGGISDTVIICELYKKVQYKNFFGRLKLKYKFVYSYIADSRTNDIINVSDDYWHDLADEAVAAYNSNYNISVKDRMKDMSQI
jgi:hypothetical protein